MTASKTGASRATARGAPARLGTNGKVKIITVRKVKLTLPSSVPFGSMRSLFKEDGTVADVVTFLEIVLGEEQMQKVWDIDLDLADGPLLKQTRELLDELSDKVTDELGLTAGE